MLAISITEAPGRKRKAVEEAYLDPIQGIKEKQQADRARDKHDFPGYYEQMMIWGWIFSTGFWRKHKGRANDRTTTDRDPD